MVTSSHETSAGGLPNGSQLSCNSAPMGAIPSIRNIPSVKIVSSKYGYTLRSNTEFEVCNVSNMQVAPSPKYFAAPQQLNDQGFITGSISIVVIQQSDLTDTQPERVPLLSMLIQDASPANGVLPGQIS